MHAKVNFFEEPPCTVKWSLWPDWLIAAGAYPGFCSMKQLTGFLLSLNRIRVHCRSLPHNLLSFPNKLAVPICTPGWREAQWDYSVLPENTAVSPTRPWTQTGLSRAKCIHPCTVPWTIKVLTWSRQRVHVRSGYHRLEVGIQWLAYLDFMIEVSCNKTHNYF